MQHQQKLKFVNIMKVADISVSDVTPETLEFLKSSAEMTYRDTVMSEHLYNISSTLDDEEEDKPIPENIRTELEKILKAMNRKECGYLRVVFS